MGLNPLLIAIALKAFSACSTRCAIEKSGNSCQLGCISSGSYCVKSR